MNFDLDNSADNNTTRLPLCCQINIFDSNQVQYSQPCSTPKLPNFCIFFKPTESISSALYINRFSEATSRARLCTLIIAEKDILHFTTISEEVSNYFKLIQQKH